MFLLISFSFAVVVVVVNHASLLIFIDGVFMNKIVLKDNAIIVVIMCDL